MNFFHRLIPFLRIEDFLNNMLTAVWVIVILLIFISSTIYLLIKFSKIRKKIKLQDFKNTHQLNKIWGAYKASFITYSGKERTSEHSDDYFNEHNIMYACLNFRVVNNISNILIGLGILGTFVGLTYGISGLDLSSKDTMIIGIRSLMSGMTTAFVTSIWGMGLSLLFTVIYKQGQTIVSRRIQELCFSLDTKYKIKQIDLDNVQEEKQREILSDLFEKYLVAETDEGKLLPSNIFRQLLKNSDNQTSSLQTFSDDLGGSIELAMEKLVEDNNAQISALIEEKLVPVLEDLKDIKQDSGTKVIEETVGKLADSMKSMMDDFKESVTGDTKNEMEGLTKRLVDVSESLSNIPSVMSDITQQIDTTIKSINNTVVSNIENSSKETLEQNNQAKEAFKEMIEALQNNVINNIESSSKNLQSQNEEAKSAFIEIVNSLQDNVKHSIQNTNEEASKQGEITRKAFEEATSEYKRSISGLQNQMENILEIQKDNINQVSSVTEDINVTLEKNSRINNQFDSMIRKSTEVAKVIEVISEKFENSSVSINQTSATLNESIDNYKKSISDYVNKNNELLNHHEDVLSKSRNIASDYANKFEVIEKGLKGIFDQIQIGLKDYQKITAENLNKYLTEFSSVLTSATDGLGSSVNGLSEISEELQEQLEKFNSKR